MENNPFGESIWARTSEVLDFEERGFRKTGTSEPAWWPRKNKPQKATTVDNSNVVDLAAAQQKINRAA
jgi:hypothetical protein